MFKEGDRVEVYRNQKREGFTTVKAGTQGVVHTTYKCDLYGEWCMVELYNSGYLIAVKNTYLKRIK